MSENIAPSYGAVYTIVTGRTKDSQLGTLLANPMIATVYNLLNDKVLDNETRMRLMQKYIPIQPKLLLSPEINQLYCETAQALGIDIMPEISKMPTSYDGHYAVKPHNTSSSEITTIEETIIAIARGLRVKDADGNAIEQTHSTLSVGMQKFNVYFFSKIPKAKLVAMEKRIKNNYTVNAAGGPTIGCEITFIDNCNDGCEVINEVSTAILINPPIISELSNICAVRQRGYRKNMSSLLQMAINPMSRYLSPDDQWRDHLHANMALQENLRYIIPSGISSHSEEDLFFPEAVKPIVYGKKLNIWVSAVPSGTCNLITANQICSFNTNPSTTGVGYACSTADQRSNKVPVTTYTTYVSNSNIAVEGHSGTPLYNISNVEMVADIPGDNKDDYKFPDSQPGEIYSIPLKE